MRATIPIRTWDPCRTAEDADLENRISNFLQQCRLPQVEKLRMDADRGTVVVSGQLKSSREKWLCLETCQRVAGVVRLIDQLAVQPDSAADTTCEELPKAA